MSSSIYQPFINGVWGTLNIEWTLTLKTPLLIRAIQKAAVLQNKPGLQKGRGNEPKVSWLFANDERDNEGFSELTDFNYHFVVEGQRVYPRYHIPASSIRGALRNATIKRLIELKNRRTFTITAKAGTPMEELTRRTECARQVLEQRRDKWFDILSLFGCTFDVAEYDDNPLTWAGRLRISTEPLESNPPQIDCVGTPLQSEMKNLRGHVNVRNPLDRISMAAKDGGLHFNLEMSEGESFTVKMRLLNPTSTDIQLVNNWREDINAGFLRFGGLTSQGRGRVEISSEKYELFISPVAEDLFQTLNGLNKDDLSRGELLEGIWCGAQLTWSELTEIYVQQN